jgi:penicillin amidase
VNAKVDRDAWGVPHLRAGDPLALAYLQGRNAATDRAWQLELERRRSLGTSAAFLGHEALSWDVFARQARLDDTAQHCWENLDDDTREWVSAYVEGVNHSLSGAALRAPEFAATGLTPQEWQPWAPIGIWLAIHILFAGFPTKLWREHVARHLGDASLDLFNGEGPTTAGSNGWLVPGHRTAAGTPIIAGDPHRYIESPGVYQQIHLACPEYDVIGLAVPGIPGLAHFGHTGGVAWAITNAMADYQDLYAEQLRRADSGVEALGPDGWQAATRHTELVEVAGTDSVEIEVIETDRGPVIIGGPDDAQAISLRYPSRVTGRVGFEVLPKLLKATTVGDLDAAVDRWVEPVNVLMAADTAGGLLHRTAGLVPTRHNDNRLRVVPAWEAEHQWQGWHESMPRATVDEAVAMANSRGLAEPLGVDFAAPHRYSRITQLLTERDDWTTGEMPLIHRDTLLGSAGSLLALLIDLEDLSPEATALRAQLLAWDKRMDAASTVASSYAALRKSLVRRLAEHPTIAVLDQDVDVPELFTRYLETLVHTYYALENLIATDLPDVNATWLAREALEEVAHRKPRGPWGETHQLTPLHALRGPVFAPGDDHYELALSGDHHCVMSTSALPGLTDVCIRASAARYAWDVADRDNSAWIVPLGTSGVLGDPHHHDQLPLWLRGDLAPVNGKLTPEDQSFEHHFEGFGLVRIQPVVPSEDLDLIYSWVTADRASFWGMTGQTREQVLATYEFLDSVPTHHAHLVHLDGIPVALIHTYDPQADPVGSAYQVEPGDLGAHFLIAPGEARPNFTGNLFHALGLFTFVHHGHPRLIADPDVANTPAITRLTRTGFTLGPITTFTQHDGTPKTTQLAFLTRSAFLAP